jgi:glycerol uptake facilitator-like aquaporin
MQRRGSLLQQNKGSVKDDEHEFLLASKNPVRRNLPKHAQMALSIIEAEHLEESENNFDTYEPTRASRFITLEFIGTYCFTLVASGSVMSTGVLTYQFGVEEQTAGRMLAISFAQGLAYTAVMYTASSFLDNKYKRRYEILRSVAMHHPPDSKHERPVSRSSGGGSFRDYPCGYFNPAITFAMAMTKTLDRSDNQVSPSMACSYVFVQICASICSTYTLSMLFDHLKVPNNPLGVPVPGDGATVVGALLMETMLTFALTMSILILLIHGENTNNDENSEEPVGDGRDELKKAREARGYIRDMAPLAIGLIHVTLSILGMPVSGASMNPARSFGTAIMANIWTEHWLYWVGPFLGSGCAAMLFRLIVTKIEK